MKFKIVSTSPDEAPETPTPAMLSVNPMGYLCLHVGGNIVLYMKRNGEVISERNYFEHCTEPRRAGLGYILGELKRC